MIETTILISGAIIAASTLIGFFMGAWITWKCLTRVPMFDKPVVEVMPDDESVEPDRDLTDEEMDDEFDDMR